MTVGVKAGRTRKTADMLPAIKLRTYTVATLPSASANIDCIIAVSNGAAGARCLAYSNGANWLRCDTLAAVAAS